MATLKCIYFNYKTPLILAGKGLQAHSQLSQCKSRRKLDTSNVQYYSINIPVSKRKARGEQGKIGIKKYSNPARQNPNPVASCSVFRNTVHGISSETLENPKLCGSATYSPCAHILGSALCGVGSFAWQKSMLCHPQHSRVSQVTGFTLHLSQFPGLVSCHPCPVGFW